MSSIRWFLVLILVACITLFNFIAALQGYQQGLSLTDNLFDKQLSDISMLLAGTRNNNKAVIETSHGDLFFQVWQGGKLLQRSSNAPDHEISSLEPGYSYITYDNARWRVYVDNQMQADQRVVIAERANRRFILSENIIRQAIIPIVSGLPLIGILIWFIVGSGLKPLSSLATNLGKKASHDLTPLNTDNSPKELRQLVSSINNLFERLSASFEREKQFSSDAAHELRTPLSTLKVNLYNLAKTLPQSDENIQSMTASVDRMSHLIEQLLLLHRASIGEITDNFEQVDLYSIAQQSIKDVYKNIEAKHQHIELRGKATLINGNAFSLSALLKNLLENANKYAPEEGHILVRVFENPNQALLVVEDSGAGIPEALRDHVMQRFYRVDGDQHPGNIPGSGLGLSIVKHIVDLHNGHIALSSSGLGGLKISIQFPQEAKA